jgi:hypothetical protein
MDSTQAEFCQKNAHIVRLTPIFLAEILSFFNNDTHKKTFINFWIACLGFKNFRWKLDEAMFLVKKIPAFLEKTWFASEFSPTALTPYLTDISSGSGYLKIEKIRVLIKKYSIVSQVQKSKPRIKILDSYSLALLKESEDSFDWIPNYYKQFRSCEHLNVTNFNGLNLFLLDAFPQLKTVSLNYHQENFGAYYDSVWDKDKVFPTVFKLYEIWDYHCDFFCRRFPFLAKITIYSENMEQSYLDLSSLEVLQSLKFGTKKRSSRSQNKATIMVHGEYLQEVNLDNSVILKSKTGNFPQLCKFKLLCYNTGFSTSDLHKLAPNLKHIRVTHYDSEVISGLKNFSQVERLELFETYKWDSQNFKLMEVKPLLELSKLTTLVLHNVGINDADKTELSKLCTSIVRLTWIDVKAFVDISNPTKLALNLNSKPDLKYLKAKLGKKENWDNFEKMVLIEDLHLIFDSRDSNIDPETYLEEFYQQYLKHEFRSSHRLIFEEVVPTYRKLSKGEITDVPTKPLDTLMTDNQIGMTKKTISTDPKLLFIHKKIAQFEYLIGRYK